jgi:hypothetical protein
MAKVQPFRARRGPRRDVAGDRVMDGIVIVIVECWSWGLACGYLIRYVPNLMGSIGDNRV